MPKEEASQAATPITDRSKRTLVLSVHVEPPPGPVVSEEDGAQAAVRVPPLPAAHAPAFARKTPVTESGTYPIGEQSSPNTLPPTPAPILRSETETSLPQSAPARRSSVLVSAVTAAVVAASLVVGVARIQPASLAPRAAQSAIVERVMVPELARIPAENIRSIIEAMGLHANIEERVDPSVTNSGVVIAQAPRAGTRLERGGHIAIVLAVRPANTPSGAAPVRALAETTTTPTVAARVNGSAEAATQAASAAPIVVPSVVRMLNSDARTWIAHAGLSVGDQHELFDEHVGPHRVLRQSPTAGTRVARGARIALWVNRE